MPLWFLWAFGELLCVKFEGSVLLRGGELEKSESGNDLSTWHISHLLLVDKVIPISPDCPVTIKIEIRSNLVGVIMVLKRWACCWTLLSRWAHLAQPNAGSAPDS